MVNPMLYGTGLNIKSIEALGFGVPLLSTPVECRGLEAGANTAYWLAQSDREFAEKALELLGDAEARQKLSAAAGPGLHRNGTESTWRRYELPGVGFFSDAVPSASRTARV